ncbi:MAG: hypothetical protein K0R10_2560, partial [Alphaproteobacteria bacterium]|nr:hypothetical protein [Alphaproteobacteria bacterium]
ITKRRPIRKLGRVFREDLDLHETPDAMHADNFGAGDLLEIKPPKGNSFYLPFTGKVVPHVDVAKKEMTVDIPHGLLD